MYEPANWAKREFSDANLGDLRRTNRLIKISEGLTKAVGSPISSVCGKSGAQTVTRLFSNEMVTLESVTEPHINQTKLRCVKSDRVLAVQDTTVLDFSTHNATTGIGYLSSSKKSSRGLLLHSVLALSPERVPLGIIGMQIWAREDANRGCANDRRKRPVCDKESNKWLIGLDQAQSNTHPDCEVVVIGDRESDIYALFAAERRPKVNLLVRLAYNRSVEDDEHKNIEEAIESFKPIGSYKIRVPRKQGQSNRDANLILSAGSVMIKPPLHRTPDIPKDPVKVWIVVAKEKDTPEGIDGIHWILTSTEPIESFEHSKRAINEYSVRWTIEEFHKVLKSGCKVEKIQFDTVEKLKPAIGIFSIVAWRVLYLTKLSRSEPEMDVIQIAERDEVAILSQWLQSQGERDHIIRNVREFTIAVARLGGFQGRKSDGMPGTKTLWQGLRALEILILGYKLAEQFRNVIKD